jgi:hypothetical protein
MENRLCILCNEIKPKDEFTPIAYKDSGYNHLRDNVCDDCKPRGKKYNHIDFKKTQSDYDTGRFKYDEIDEIKYDILYTLQEGRCKICERHQSEFKKRLAVDHDHITNEVRGLLCGQCNSAIGLFKDNINSLRNAILYLKESKTPLEPERLKAIRLELIKRDIV